MANMGYLWQTISSMLQPSNNFDKYFDEKNLQIEKLLDDENIISEFKNSNPKLMTYFKLDKFEILIKYIIEDPPDSNDRKRGYKFPFISCELLTCDIVQVYDAFFAADKFQEAQPEDDEDDDQENKEENEAEESIEQDQDKQNEDVRIEQEEEEIQEIPQRYSMKGKQKKPQEEDSNYQSQNKNELNQDNNEQITSQEGDTINQPRSYKEASNQREAGADQESQKREQDSSNSIQLRQNKQQNISEKDEDNNNRPVQPQQHLIDSSFNNASNNRSDRDKRSAQQLKQISALAKNYQTVAYPQQDNQESQEYYKIQQDKQQVQPQQEVGNEENNQLKEKESKQQKKQKEKKVKIPKEPTYLLQMLFSFLNVQSEVNITLAGYFSKVLNALFSKKETELIEFLYSRQIIINNFLRQIQSKSLTEIFCKFIGYQNKAIQNNYMQQRCDIIGQLIQNVTNNNDAENSSFIINEIILKYQVINAGPEIIKFIINDQNCQLIFTGIISQIRAIQVSGSQDEEQKDMEPDPIIDYQSLIDNFIKFLPQIITQLEVLPQIEYQTSFNQKLQPLGMVRLKIIELFNLAIRVNNFNLLQEISRTNLYQILMKLYQQYEQNNLMHALVEKIFISSLENQQICLKRALIIDANLVQFLYDSTRQVKTSYSDRFRLSNLGHITRIGNLFSKLLENDFEFKNEVLSNNLWQEFYQKYLVVTNQKDQKDLGGHSSRKSDEFKDNNNFDFDKEQIKNKYAPFFGRDSLNNNKEKSIQQSEAIDDYEIQNSEQIDQSVPKLTQDNKQQKPQETNINQDERDHQQQNQASIQEKSKENEEQQQQQQGPQQQQLIDIFYDLQQKDVAPKSEAISSNQNNVWVDNDPFQMISNQNKKEQDPNQVEASWAATLQEWGGASAENQQQQQLQQQQLFDQNQNEFQQQDNRIQENNNLKYIENGGDKDNELSKVKEEVELQQQANQNIDILDDKVLDLQPDKPQVQNDNLVIVQQEEIKEKIVEKNLLNQAELLDIETIQIEQKTSPIKIQDQLEEESAQNIQTVQQSNLKIIEDQ